MAPVDSQDLSSVARGCEAISIFVFFLYSSKAAAILASRFVEEVAVDDMVPVEGDCLGR